MHHRSGAVDLSARRKGHARGSPVGLRRIGYHAMNEGRSGAVYERPNAGRAEGSNPYFAGPDKSERN